MSDMLVKLYRLPDRAAAALEREGIVIRRALASESRVIAGWARQRFSDAVAADCEAALAQRPVACHVAVQPQTPGAAQGYHDLAAETLIGFACHDVAARGMFGPLGVAASMRERGIGKALLLTSLHAMVEAGYAYAVIGWAGVPEFYAHCVGATLIEDSEPGIYRGKLVPGAA